MILCILVLLCFPLAHYPMATSFTLPMNIYKTRFSTPHLKTFLWQATQTKATESKNECGQTVPLLSFSGKEDLLNRFIDATLPYNDTSSVGQALLSGTLLGNINLFLSEINIDNGIYFGNKIAFSQLTLKNIGVHPISPSGQCLTEEEIQNDPSLSAYLPIFYKNILQNGSPLQESFCSALYFTIGWAKNWQHFTHADFINISIQTGIQVPPFTLDSCCSRTLFKIPTYPQYGVGFPFEIDAEFGFLNWLNIGLEGIATFFISTEKTIQLNPSATNNTILPSSSVAAKIHQYPFLYVHTYLEADEFIPKISLLCGVTYAKQFQTTYTPIDQQKYPCTIINNYSLHKPWTRITCNVELQADFTFEPTKCSPRLKFLYIQPVYEQATYQTRLLGGEFAIDISGTF